MAKACQSYVFGRQICRDGFPIVALCSGGGRCPHCGRYSTDPRHLPGCQREDFGPQFLDESGMPKFAEYRRKANG